jgi:hypothetical protein
MKNIVIAPAILICLFTANVISQKERGKLRCTGYGKDASDPQ